MLALTIFLSIMRDANVAKAQLLRGHDSAADDRLSDIGSRLVENAYALPSQSAQGTVTNGSTLNVYADGSMHMPTASSTLAPRMDQSHSRAPSPPPSSQTTLAPPFELQRSSSVKRSAPESPSITSATLAANKHIRLGEGAEGSVSPMAPPPLVHAHSFPNGHQLPSQHVNHMAPQSMPMSPGGSMTGNIAFSNVPSSATFAPTLIIPQQSSSHAPHQPSPLSSIPINSHPPSPSGVFRSNHQAAQSAVPLQTMHTWDTLAGLQHPGEVNQMTLHSDQEGMFIHNDGAVFALQQPTASSRRGSIIDGRMIAGRPMASALQSEHKSMSASAVPTVSTVSYMARRPPTPIDDDEGESDSGAEDGSPMPQLKRRRSSADVQGMTASTSGKLVVPQVLVSDQIREQLDIILDDFLQKVCSDRESRDHGPHGIRLTAVLPVEFTDNKGELLHQALMPKKMARLNESPDFRPFKFRIQAFTNAFHDELQSRGLKDDTLSAKKVKSFLWTNSLISRFNDDGKKSKSKGNHIWNVDAKRLPEGTWIFRPFRRKIAGVPPQQAYIGTPYIWTPRVWDPQASTNGLQVEFSSPPGTLPGWLRWEDTVLTGVPEDGDVGGQITAVASVSRC